MAKEPSSTTLIPVKEIRDTAVILKDGTLRSIVELSAVNFELRSTDEQTAILEQFQGFLNAVDFPIQIVAHSRQFDVSVYLASIQTATEQLTNELLRVQAAEYIRFVSELSELAHAMSKRFFVVLSYTASVAAPTAKGLFGGIKGIFAKKPTTGDAVAPEQFATAINQLRQRAEIILGGLSGVGVTGHILGQDELTKLFTLLYNPVVPTAAATQGVPTVAATP